MENSLCKQYSTVEGGNSLQYIDCVSHPLRTYFYVFLQHCLFSQCHRNKTVYSFKNRKTLGCMVTIKLPSKTPREYKLNTSSLLDYSVYMRNIIWPNNDICYVRKLSNNRWLKDCITVHYRQLNTSINRIAKRWLSSRSNNPLLYICLFMVCAYDWLTLNVVLLI